MSKKKITPQTLNLDITIGLSGIVRKQNEIWIANDDSNSLERIVVSNDGTNDKYEHVNPRAFDLNNYFDLPVKNGPAIDLEGLDYCDDYLWLVGSHSRDREGLPGLNRYFLGRIQLKKDNDLYTLASSRDQEWAVLRGDAGSNELIIALGIDSDANGKVSDLAKSLEISGKKLGGLNIEGLAVGKNNRIFLGLRGPIIDGLALILELQLEKNPENPHELILKSIDSSNPNKLYRIHRLQLEGLGIRDLCADEGDLLILAGPTLSEGDPFKIFRWKSGMNQIKDTEIHQDENNHELKELLIIPRDEQVIRRGKAEAMTVFSKDNGKIDSVLVLYDINENVEKTSLVRADIFELTH